MTCNQKMSKQFIKDSFFLLEALMTVFDRERKIQNEIVF